ncbi:unnamed protein product [Cuscuta epithymum]|uniref:FBD domain-containing protein n=1 Tax=Cuscuta epithymum TaxID=186058 RepID=A0AAV0F6R3_9ASTE|nr:unnamed protein product [Cuscuta epithymum]
MLIDNKYQHDIISNLHESLKQSILMCLPLKDAARTSVLSRKWKYSWTTLPHLKLDETLWQGSSIDDLAVYNGHWNSSFEEFFSSLPMLRYLGLDYDFMKCVAGGGAPTRPSFAAAVHLNILFLGGISLEDLHEMLCVVFVIGISPNLQEIQINLADDIDDFASSEESSIVKLLGLKEYSYIKLDHLRIVTFLNFSGTRNQMGLAKFLLMRSPRLKKLLISSDANLSSERRFFILKELTRLQRSSPSAELIYD